jgi:hypothetical protein
MTLHHCRCDKAECPECGPLVALAEEIRQEFEHTRQHARVPTAEIVWWRAQMRAREEAARTAARPILLTQALAVASLIGLVVSLAGRVTLPAISWPELALIPESLPLLPLLVAAACSFVLAPVAVYLALSRD